MKGRVRMSLLTNTYDVHKGEFETAGDASASIKRKLKQLGVDSTVLRRVAVVVRENALFYFYGPEHVRHTFPCGSCRIFRTGYWKTILSDLVATEGRNPQYLFPVYLVYPSGDHLSDIVSVFF